MPKKLISLLLSLSLILPITFSFSCFPAAALLRQHHETENILRYHAQDSLKDRDGNTWQVILFPDKRDSPDSTYYLRLVAFPGVNAFVHPQSLEIITNRGEILIAPDSYALSSPSPNVGQFNLTPIIAQLSSAKNLKLSIPLENNRELALKISAEVLAEWKMLVQEIEKISS